ncbi:MAG: hypothetical protein JJT77_10460 [Crocinitomicaceae bacterium]|nr:hypothetical protein [Crocinitomicaceae bacterium]
MKNSLSFLLIFVLAFGCGESSSVQDDSSFEMDGPELEVKVISFSVDNNTTIIELTNRTDEAIQKLEGRLRFLDEYNEIISFSNGNPKDSPFSLVQNPEILKAKSQLEITLRNSIPSTTQSIVLIDVKATFNSGGAIPID